MKRRKNHEGSYGTCVKKGITYKYYKAPNGHFIYAKTDKELQIKKKEYERFQIQNDPGNPLLDSKYTVSKYAHLWLKTKRGQITPHVYDEYERVIENHITKYNIGQEKIHYLTPIIVNEFLLQLAAKYSRSTIDKDYLILRQVISHAIDNGVLNSFNFKKVKKPNEDSVKVKKRDIPFITEDDMEELYKESLDPKYGMGAQVVIFIMYSGLRVSEACALQWDCVSKDFSSIQVKRSQVLVSMRDEFGNPILNDDGQTKIQLIDKDTKTKSGNRLVPLPQRAKDILQQLYNGQKSGRVFLTAKGNPFTKDLIRRTLDRMLKNSNCYNKNYTVHSLRHGYGSLLVKKGVDIKIVSELLGHSDVTTTYNIYIGVLKQDKIDAVKNVFDT